MPGYNALPCCTAVASAPIASSNGVSGVGAVAVEDVDIVQAEPVQALIEAHKQVLPALAEAGGARPHVPARLAGDGEFVPQPAKALAQDAPRVERRPHDGAYRSRTRRTS